MNQLDHHWFRPFLKKHALTIAVGILAIVYVWWSHLPEGVLLAPLSSTNVFRLVLIGSFFLLLIFADQSKQLLFEVTNSVLMPLSAALILIYIVLDPVGADGLAHEDRLIEDFSFIFWMVAVVCMIGVAYRLLRYRQRLAMAAAGALAIVFFVIGMEEISWFQHVLEYDSADIFRERNSQGETNFHNFYSHESEDIFYVGGFLLLVVLPYFRAEIIALLEKLEFPALGHLVPAYWLLAPAIIAGAFVSPFFVSRSANVAITLGSLVILIGATRRHVLNREWWRCIQLVITGVLFITITTYLLGFSPDVPEVRAWIGKEYQEFFIAWGVMSYTVSVLFSMWPGTPSKSTHAVG